ncbi:MAG: MarR family winged helix-turn-helix transcriptional regulator [Mycobacteriales bacterium]
MPRLSERQYRDLLAFRVALRRFNRWSEDQARAAGLTHAQHQLLLTVRAHADPRGPTIGEVADYLLLRHHSAVELIDRAATAGVIERGRDDEDARVVRLALTPLGAERIAQLTALHLEELRRLAPFLDHLTEGLDGG